MDDLEVREVDRTKTKRKFQAYIGRRNTGFTAKEIMNDDSVRWYPFYRSGREISNRYQNIKYVVTSDKKVPKAGFSMSDRKGYGFTSAQGVDKFIKYIDRNIPGIKVIAFMLSGDTKYKKSTGTLELAYKDFAHIRRLAKQFHEGKRTEQEALIKNTLNTLLPKAIKPAPKYVYTPGGLSGFVSKYSARGYDLSEEDRQALGDLLTDSGIPAEQLISTKREIDKVYIEDVLTEFKKLYALPKGTSNLEEKWQKFFRKHTWIFSQVFAFPAVFLREKFNVGGHDIGDSTDKIVDFIYKNKLTSNITFIEIKTHLTKLLNDAPYRKPDIYSINKEVSGAMVQVLDQQNQFLKQYHSLKGDTGINSLNSDCLVIVGDLGSLKSTDKKDSFELFRSTSKDVKVITFDEVLEKITVLLDIFTKS
jgi:hypothetical protein